MTTGARRVLVVGGDLGYLVRFRGHLVATLVAAGHEVVVATPDPEPPQPTPLERMGVRYERLALNRTGMNPWRDVQDGRRAEALLRRLRPDVVFAYGAKPITVVLAAAARAGVPRRYAMLAGLGYAFVADGSPSSTRALARTAQLVLYRRVFRGCRRVVFHNADDRDELVRRGVVDRAKTTVVGGSGVDLDRYAATPVPTEPPRFLFVGRLLGSKGVEELVRAAAIVRASEPAAEVHLVGSFDPNPDRVDPTLLEQAQQRGDVVLHGQVADVRPHLAACSAFVLPSYREGLPRSALEALACGRTAVVTDVPGCREVVRPGRHGALVPVRDVDALARTLIAYARDPERLVREGAEARRTAERDFGVEAVTAAMLDALELQGPVVPEGS